MEAKPTKQYTMADLHRVQKAYEENFEKLWNAVGTPLHDKYIKIERQLHREGMKIRACLDLFNQQVIRETQSEMRDLKTLFQDRIVTKNRFFGH